MSRPLPCTSYLAISSWQNAQALYVHSKDDDVHSETCNKAERPRRSAFLPLQLPLICPMGREHVLPVDIVFLLVAAIRFQSYTHLRSTMLACTVSARCRAPAFGVQQGGRSRAQPGLRRVGLSIAFPRLQHCSKLRALQAQQDAEAKTARCSGFASTLTGTGSRPTRA